MTESIDHFLSFSSDTKPNSDIDEELSPMTTDNKSSSTAHTRRKVVQAVDRCQIIPNTAIECQVDETPKVRVDPVLALIYSQISLTLPESDLKALKYKPNRYLSLPEHDFYQKILSIFTKAEGPINHSITPALLPQSTGLPHQTPTIIQENEELHQEDSTPTLNTMSNMKQNYSKQALLGKIKEAESISCSQKCEPRKIIFEAKYKEAIEASFKKFMSSKKKKYKTPYKNFPKKLGDLLCVYLNQSIKLDLGSHIKDKLSKKGFNKFLLNGVNDLELDRLVLNKEFVKFLKVLELDWTDSKVKRDVTKVIYEMHVEMLKSVGLMIENTLRAKDIDEFYTEIESFQPRVKIIIHY